MTIYTIANQKGGVGKTTTAVTLAHGLALAGERVLLIDLDSQGQAATALGLAPEPGIFNWLVSGRPWREQVREARPRLDVIPGDIKSAFAQVYLTLQQEGVDALAGRIRKDLIKSYDQIVIDTSPSVGGLQERALYACDVAIIPTAMDILSADAIAATMRTMLQNRAWGSGAASWVLPTFFDETTRESREMINQLVEVYSDNTLPCVHRATAFREAVAHGQTIFEYAPNSRGAHEYALVVERVGVR